MQCVKKLATDDQRQRVYMRSPLSVPEMIIILEVDGICDGSREIEYGARLGHVERLSLTGLNFCSQINSVYSEITFRREFHDSAGMSLSLSIAAGAGSERGGL